MAEGSEELKVKDLLIKLQVLTNGLIEERKKSKNYLDRIKEYEESLQKRELEVAELTKEKFELKSKLSLERSKSGSWAKDDKPKFGSKMSNELKIQKLEEKINQQNFELKDYSQRLMEDKELFDQQKIQLQTMITIQNQQMAQLKEKIRQLEKELKEEKEKKEKAQEKKDEKNEYDKHKILENEEKERRKMLEKEKREKEDKEKKEKEEKEKIEKAEKEEKEKKEKEEKIKKEIEEKIRREYESNSQKTEVSQFNQEELINRMNKKFDMERDEFERKLQQIRKELRDEKNKNENLKAEAQNYKELYESAKNENIAMKNQIASINTQKRNMNNEKEDSLTQRIFQVERVKSKGIVKNKQTMIIKFQWNQNKNICEVFFKRAQHKGKQKEDSVNILNLKMNKKSEYIDFSFNVSKYLCKNIFLIF